MENAELNKIGKRIENLQCGDTNAVGNLITLIDKIYIILDELNHINLFNDRLSAIKSNLASVDCHKAEERERFNAGKKELIELIEETHLLV